MCFNSIHDPSIVNKIETVVVIQSIIFYEESSFVQLQIRVYSVINLLDSDSNQTFRVDSIAHWASWLFSINFRFVSILIHSGIELSVIEAVLQGTAVVEDVSSELVCDDSS